MSEATCPNCNSNDISYIEVRGVYDGVLIVVCQRCGHQWPRFPDGRLHRQALELIQKWNDTKDAV
jgi:Zn ribbon nucleic-acid-binding protein